jgi:hypothetical protein
MKQEIAFLGRNMPVVATMKYDPFYAEFKVVLHPEFHNPAEQNTLITTDGKTCHARTIDDMVSHFRNVLEHGHLEDVAAPR